MSEQTSTTPFANQNPDSFGPDQRDEAVLNAGEPAPGAEQEQAQEASEQEPEQELAPVPEPETVQEQEAATGEPKTVTVNINGEPKTVTDIKTDGPPGSVGSAELDGKKYVVVEADKYQPITGGRKTKRRATKRSARKSSKRRKSGRKGRR